MNNAGERSGQGGTKGPGRLIKLPSILRKNGCAYREVLREGRTCIYEQMVAENLNYYELFIVRVKPERIVKGINL